jgi:hypothetical protein
MRAGYPDTGGFIDRDGVKVGRGQGPGAGPAPGPATCLLLVAVCAWLSRRRATLPAPNGYEPLIRHWLGGL